jgi:hypothetical protein
MREPGLRIVGMTVSHEALVTLSPSSTQRTSRPSFDLIEATLCRRPAKMKSEPLRPLISLSVTS